MKKALEKMLDNGIVTTFSLTALMSMYTAISGYAVYELFHQDHPLIGTGAIAYTGLMAYISIATGKEFINEVKKK